MCTQNCDPAMTFCVYRYCTWAEFSTWKDILQKSASTSYGIWLLPAETYCSPSLSKNWQLFSNFSMAFVNFWVKKQQKINWAHFFSIKSTLSVQICDNPYPWGNLTLWINSLMTRLLQPKIWGCWKTRPTCWTWKFKVRSNFHLD